MGHNTVSDDRRGARMINLRMAGGNSRQVTVAITITASGHQLPLLIVFTGKLLYCCTGNTVSNIMVDCCILAAGMPNGTIAHYGSATTYAYALLLCAKCGRKNDFPN